jgi:hypothetical protein
VLLSFVVPCYLVTEQVFKVPPAFGRYVLPLSGPYVLAAVLLGEALAPPAARALGRLAPPPPVGAALFAAALGAYPTLRTAQVLAAMGPGEDTRDRMGAWMKANLPPRTGVLTPLVPAYYPAPAGFHVEVPFSAEEATQLAGLAPSRARAYDYVLASSLVYDRYFDFPDASPELRRFYERVFAEGRLVASFEAPPGGSYLFQNPTLRLYRLR